MSADHQLFDATKAWPVVVGFDATRSAYEALRHGAGMAAAHGMQLKLVIGQYGLGSTGSPFAAPVNATNLYERVERQISPSGNFPRSFECIFADDSLGEHLQMESEQASCIVIGAGEQFKRIPWGRRFDSETIAVTARCPTYVVPVYSDANIDEGTENRLNAPVIYSDSSVFDIKSFGAEENMNALFENSIVVGLDHMGRRAPALWAAARLASSEGAPLRIISAVEDIAEGPEWMPSKKELKQSMNEGAEGLVAAGVAVERLFPHLDVKWTLFRGEASAVLKGATRIAKILVLGSRARSYISRRIFGSITNRILVGSRCPTLIFRHNF